LPLRNEIWKSSPREIFTFYHWFFDSPAEDPPSPLGWSNTRDSCLGVIHLTDHQFFFFFYSPSYHFSYKPWTASQQHCDDIPDLPMVLSRVPMEEACDPLSDPAKDFDSNPPPLRKYKKIHRS
jgi:hypothetical protein